MSLYIWAGIAILILFLVWQIVRWWNLPATIEAREKAQAARAERRANRPRLFGNRRISEEKKPEISETPKGELKPETPAATKPPLDTGAALEAISEKKPRRPRKRRILDR